MKVNYKWSITIICLLLLKLSTYAQHQTTNSVEQPLTNFNDQQPVFKLKGEQLENKNRHLHFYALTGYRDGIEPIVSQFNMNFLAQKDHAHGTHRIKMYNLSIVDMLTHGLTKSDEVILEVKDPYKYRYDPKYGSKENWIRKNTYCYELLLPENVLKSMEVVRNHLSFLFKVKCGYQKRFIKTTTLKDGTLQESNIEKQVFVITDN